MLQELVVIETILNLHVHRLLTVSPKYGNPELGSPNRLAEVTTMALLHIVTARLVDSNRRSRMIENRVAGACSLGPA